jgi:periplasmic protein CpxP/Spy
MKTHNPYWKPFAAATLVAFGLSSLPLRSAEAEETDESAPQHCASHDGGHERHGPMAGGPFGMAGGGLLPPFLRGLDLSEAQRDKVFTLRHDHEPRQHALMKTMRGAMQALRALASEDSFDAAKARQLADTHGKAMADLAMLHAEMAARVRALLTPEQRQQADEMIKARGPKGAGPQQHRPG